MNKLSAALLAGGRSRRMGADKAFLDWQSRPLWRHQMEKLQSLTPEQLIVSCRPEQEFPVLPGVTRVQDARENCGPLEGIAACLRVCSAPQLLVLGIDLPLLPEAFLKALADAASEDCGAVVQSGEWYEPLAAVYPATLLPMAERHLDEGRLSLQELIRAAIADGQMRCVSLPVESAWFTNWNRPGDLS